MKKIFILIISYVILLCLTSCDKTKSDSSNNNVETTNKIEVNETTKGNESVSNNLKMNEIKVVMNKNTALKSVVLIKQEKEKLFKMFVKNDFNIYLFENDEIEVPSEIRLVKNFDKYNNLCYSVYKYKDNKLFAFIIREQPDPTRSSFRSNVTTYEGLFLLPMDKEYSIKDFEDIEINKSDLSDVKKIYKYADILFEQELQTAESKKKCSINIMSEGSGITISFKKKGNKYIVTKIEDNADGSFVSMIADADKSFD